VDDDGNDGHIVVGIGVVVVVAVVVVGVHD
jgi:hypothetical protein